MKTILSNILLIIFFFALSIALIDYDNDNYIIPLILSCILTLILPITVYIKVLKPKL